MSNDVVLTYDEVNERVLVFTSKDDATDVTVAFFAALGAIPQSVRNNYKPLWNRESKNEI